MFETLKNIYIHSAFIVFIFYTIQLTVKIEKKLNYVNIFFSIFLPIYNTIVAIGMFLKIIKILSDERENEIKNRGRR